MKRAFIIPKWGELYPMGTDNVFENKCNSSALNEYMNPFYSVLQWINSLAISISPSKIKLMHYKIKNILIKEELK